VTNFKLVALVARLDLSAFRALDSEADVLALHLNVGAWVSHSLTVSRMLAVLHEF
jgi:hypothetical protein